MSFPTKRKHLRFVGVINLIPPSPGKGKRRGIIISSVLFVCTCICMCVVISWCYLLVVVAVSTTLISASSSSSSLNVDGYVKSYPFRIRKEEGSNGEEVGVGVGVGVEEEYAVMEEVGEMCHNEEEEEETRIIMSSDLDMFVVYQKCSLKNAALYVRDGRDVVRPSEIKELFFESGDSVDELLIDDGEEITCECEYTADQCDEEHENGKKEFEFHIFFDKVYAIPPWMQCFERMNLHITLEMDDELDGCVLTYLYCDGYVTNPKE